jgi:hypothetical protein
MQDPCSVGSGYMSGRWWPCGLMWSLRIVVPSVLLCWAPSNTEWALHRRQCVALQDTAGLDRGTSVREALVSRSP